MYRNSEKKEIHGGLELNIMLRQERDDYLNLMDQYIEMYKVVPDDVVKEKVIREKARLSLIRSGILDKDGKQKSTIINR